MPVPQSVRGLDLLYLGANPIPFLAFLIHQDEEWGWPEIGKYLFISKKTKDHSKWFVIFGMILGLSNGSEVISRLCLGSF